MMRRAILLLTVCATAAALAQTPADPGPPDFPPSDEVHISPAGSTSSGPITVHNPNYWVARGFTLRGIISKVFATHQQVYGIPQTRLVIPPQLDDGKQYDFAIVPPQRLADSEIINRLQAAIQSYFHIRVVPKMESKEVYVLTAPDGPLPALRDVSQERAHLNVRSTSLSLAGGDISGSNVKMPDLTYMLERTLQEIVVDGTNLKGLYDFKVPGKRGGSAETIAALRDQLGLVLTRQHRGIELLVVKPE